MGGGLKRIKKMGRREGLGELFGGGGMPGMGGGGMGGAGGLPGLGGPGGGLPSNLNDLLKK